MTADICSAVFFITFFQQLDVAHYCLFDNKFVTL